MQSDAGRPANKALLAWHEVFHTNSQPRSERGRGLQDKTHRP